jgi:hypothetical protein
MMTRMICRSSMPVVHWVGEQGETYTFISITGFGGQESALYGGIRSCKRWRAIGYISNWVGAGYLRALWGAHGTGGQGLGWDGSGVGSCMGVIYNAPTGEVGCMARSKKSAVSGQYKVNMDTGDIYVVGSKATERPNLEKQVSLLQWSEDKVKLERWEKQG